jgi:peptidoglycan/LPS O-acetylase OafA/YrhL
VFIGTAPVAGLAWLFASLLLVLILSRFTHAWIEIPGQALARSMVSRRREPRIQLMRRQHER